MLISPPFLPDRTATQTEDPWLDAAMVGAEDGIYPVSHRLGWHGGRHLVAPTAANGGNLAVRAVADGTVLFARQRTAAEAHTHPLWYGSGYTSDAVVVIGHDTEIGADADDRPVALRYYSVYHHLHGIEPAIRAGQPVRRKDALGTAGHIYGAPGRMHFEICLDTENLLRLVGRAAGDLPLTRDGRADVLYGEVYFRLPAGTPAYAAPPPLGTATLASGAQILARNDEDWFVGLRYDRGDATLTTYRASGQAVAAAHLEADHGEYRLFARAQALSDAVRQANAAGNRPADPVPSASACQELLRWGRVLGHEPLTPPSTPHWRQINTPAGLGWVNLNAQGVTKYSDADFPQWRGWTLIDDSADRDSRCDSQEIRKLLDADGDGTVTLGELETRLRSDAVRQRLARTICRFPSEWEAATLDARWGWLRRPSRECPEPLDAEGWTEFRAHAQALCFECPAVFQAQWCLEPQAFIRHLRQCGWRSAREVAQMVPSHAIRGAMWEEVKEVSIEPDSLFGKHRISLNRSFRKYGISTPLRQAVFLGNSMQETMWFDTFSEGSGPSLWYAPWYGRGFLQLTNPENYCEYWIWRGRMVPSALQKNLTDAYKAIAKTNHPRSNATLADKNFTALTQQMQDWRAHVQAEPHPNQPEERFAPSDSAGYYWLKNNMARYADEEHVLERCVVSTKQGQKMYYRSPAFWRASAAVNLPNAIKRTDYKSINGFDSRCSAYGVALAILTELRLPDIQAQETLWYPEGYARRPLK